jgi:hypothetical protein
MSIEKKSLISTLKTTKKANVAKEDLSHASVTGAVKSPARMLATRKTATRKTATRKTATRKTATLKLGTRKMT